MINIIDGLLATLFLIPGFICIFFPYRLMGKKIRFTQYELTLSSLGISILIFFFGLKTYQFFTPIFDLNKIILSSISTSDLINNTEFLLVLFLYTIFFLILGLIFIPQDRMVKIRGIICGHSRELLPGDNLWEIAFDRYGPYIVIQTQDNKYFLGFRQGYSFQEENNAVLLKHPEEYNITNHQTTPLKQFDSILFLQNDIKRVYFKKKLPSK